MAGSSLGGVSVGVGGSAWNVGIATRRGAKSFREYYVDGNRGNDGVSRNDNNPNQPWLTMNKAFNNVSSGDTIHLKGNIREQLTTPAGVFDVQVIGSTTRTRHPDAHTTNGGFSSCRWNAPASPTSATPLVKVQQQGWQFHDILFTGDEPNDVGCIQLFRDGGSGDSERDASHALIQNCRFQAGLYGIQDSGGCARVKIDGCEFLLFSVSDNDAITQVTGAGIGTLWGWEIGYNNFHANYSDIDGAFTGAYIHDNQFHLVSLGVTNAIAIDLTGGSRNLVHKNTMWSPSDLAGSINARFVSGTNDFWGPNYYSEKEEYAEPAE